MTTETTVPTRRVFRYGAHTLPDPGPEYSAGDVLAHLKQFFPELGHATIEEETLADGAVAITFRKQVTRKGAPAAAEEVATADGPAGGDPADALVAALAALPAFTDPLAPLYATLADERPLTLRAVRRHRALLREHAGRIEEQTETIAEVIDACCACPPIPLAAIPAGF